MHIPAFDCKQQRRALELVGQIEVRSLLSEKLHHLHMAVMRGQRHRSLTNVRHVIEMLKDLDAFVSEVQQSTDDSSVTPR